MLINNSINIKPNIADITIESLFLQILNILKKNNAKNNPSYILWQEDFKYIYDDGNVSSNLYLNHGLLYYIGLGFYIKYLYDSGKQQLDKEIFFKELELKNLRLNYFRSISNSFISRDFNDLISLVIKIIAKILEIVKRPEYLFDYLVQKLMTAEIRHESGEFFTPPFLVKKMVKDTYIFGTKVLDPCCGSGNFLIEVLKNIISSQNKESDVIKAINNINGYDINPLSIFLTKLSLLYILKDFPQKFNLNLSVCDFLFLENEKKNEKFDLIIGNPPWYTLRDIKSINYQRKIKDLSIKLEIKPQPKNVLNIEISTLFFNQAKNRYMKNGSRIFFLITKGVITGSHTSRFRCFKGFKNIFIWMFDKVIERVFNIDFICLYAEKANKNLENLTFEIPVFCFKINNGNESINYFNETELTQISAKRLVPYSIEEKGGKKFIKKLIFKDIQKHLIPIDDCYYKELFHKGADLNPRNLIFVNCEENNDNYVRINPDKRIFRRAKEPWTKIEYNDYSIEKKYIFDVIKSTELVKFYVYNSYKVFLPISKDTLDFNYDQLEDNAKAFYDFINKIYLKKKKQTTQHNSLMENLNRWGKLINKRQLSKIKVVYNNSGSILNAAIVKGEYLITGDLSFFATNSLNEAYYLLAILNSTLMTEQIKIKKSSRHIFKIPFDVPIKKFDPIKESHKKLVILAKRCENTVKSFINNNFMIKEKILKNTIQNKLKIELKEQFAEIDDILRLEFV